MNLEDDLLAKSPSSVIGHTVTITQQGIRSMASSDQLSYEQIEDQLHRLLGRFFIAFAGVELNLSLRTGGDGNFREKLERFIDAAGTQFSLRDEEFCKISEWYMAADTLRETRNRFAHGRWGILPSLQLVAHVLGYPPGAQYEQRFSLPELEALVKDAEALNKELSKIAY